MSATADQIVTALDECPASPALRAKIAYRLLDEINPGSELIIAIMAQYQVGFIDEEARLELTERLGKARDMKDDPAMHLAWGLLPFDDALDGYLAEFYYDWAMQLGVPNERVSELMLQLGVAG